MAQQPWERGAKTQVRCFAHILNLVAKAILAPFATKSIPKKDLPTDANANCLELEIDNLKDNDVVNEDNNPSQDLNNNDKLDKEVAVDVARSNAVDVNFAAEEADLDGHLDPLPQAVRAASALSITKLCKLGVKIAHSPTILEALYELCNKAGIKHKRMVGDVPTC
ncbi:hypothetical protein D9619_005714 [Psilocybe cf. subviscida]|uniref:HAT C-terminal dimerisation domain-containing protein n=1 Tax=Psilocybe cf. subviscida TaxID=2480587 RepID=A0A8H5BWC3_9AGAR|nr:hypothetical protein D9619_005714 [Psilocybe cf. subviscida]